MNVRGIKEIGFKAQGGDTKIKKWQRETRESESKRHVQELVQ